MKHALRRLMVIVVAAGLAAAIAGCRDSGHDVPHLESMAEFNEKVVDADRPVLVDFYMDGCPPCRRLAPVIADLHADYAGRADVYKIYNRTARGIFQHFEVRSVPTIVLFNAGEPVDDWTGVPGGDADRADTILRKALDDALAGG
ncbi:MAG: thioredoxin fold domain-containing protein [Phycisphaerae bacterium]|nr:thioredoxin fold domain-containing protein [Phycisphaerae bacterium]